MGADGTIKVVDSDGLIHALVGSDWVENPKFFAASRIAVDGQGMAWTVDKFAGTVYAQTSGGSGWQSVDGVLARDIAIGGPFGDVWVIAQDGLSLHKYSGGAWRPEYYLAGVEAASISIDVNGNPWFTASADGRLYSW